VKPGKATHYELVIDGKDEKYFSGVAIPRMSIEARDQYDNAVNIDV
jgi:hypothetical protein